MKYPIAIEHGNDGTAWGVVVPDLPGCFSAGDSLEDAYEGAKQAIAAWINAALDSGEVIPTASDMGKWVDDPDYRDFAWGVVDVDMADFGDEMERVNITVPKRVLKQIDAHVAKSGGQRSSFLTNVALEAIHRAA